MGKYRRGGTLVEAVLWTGKNQAEIVELVADTNAPVKIIPPFSEHSSSQSYKQSGRMSIAIYAPGGTKTAEEGDYIVKDPDGTLFVWDPYAFKESHAEVKDETEEAS